MSVNFSNEEAKAVLREKIVENITNLASLTKSTIKSSKSNELFNDCFKKFASIENSIENTNEKLNKINILAAQLKFQQESLAENTSQFGDICNQINKICQK
jgi:ABC-type transporter Mla subunit MlaD